MLLYLLHRWSQTQQSDRNQADRELDSLCWQVVRLLSSTAVLTHQRTLTIAPHALLLSAATGCAHLHENAFSHQ
jgi:hypothetical protein